MSAAALPLPRARTDGAPRAHGALLAILGMAAAARIIAWWIAPGTLHPDEIYQYFEPAHRLLTGEGIVTWEWREGMRGWLLPLLIAAPMALGRVLGGSLDLLLPHLAMIALSMSIVHTAWRLGARQSPAAALVAAVAAASWYNFIYFAPRTLSEPIATALIFPAALWLADREAGPRRLAAAGALLALAIIARPHYAPAAAVLALVALGRRLPQAMLPVAAGGIAALALGALADWSQGQPPFAWVLHNIRLNVVEDRASSYGTMPPAFYVSHWLEVWGWWTPIIVVGFVLGWRASPALAAAAIVNLAVHCLIGHKEPRFVFLSEAAFVVLAAIGTAELARGRKLSAGVLATLWVAASTVIATHGEEAGIWRTMRPGQLAFQALRHDPEACGLAMVGTGFGEVPGQSHLPRGLSLAQFADRDPWVKQPRTAFMPYAAAYNRVFVPFDALVPGYRSVLCANDRYDRYCLMARPGGCAAVPGTQNWAVQQVLLRSGR